MEINYSFPEKFCITFLKADGTKLFIETTGNWLTDAEMTQFDQWLYQRAPLYLERNYLEGQGSTAMSATETIAVAEWARAVRARIWQE